MSPGPQGVPALHPQDSRVRMLNRINLSSRPNPAAFPPACGGGLGRGVAQQKVSERKERCWRTQAPQPTVPLPGNLILPEIKFCNAPSKPVALHNVDILGRHG